MALTKQRVPVLCLLLAETTLKLVNRKRRTKIGNIIPLVFDPYSDAADRRRRIGNCDDCKQAKEDRRSRKLAGKGFSRENVKSKSGLPVSTAVLFKEDASVVSMKQVYTSSSRDVSFSSRAALNGTRHLSGTLHGQKPQRKTEGRAMALRSSNVLQNSRTSRLPRSFAKPIRIYSDRRARSLKLLRLLLTQIVWPVSTIQKRVGNVKPITGTLRRGFCRLKTPG